MEYEIKDIDLKRLPRHVGIIMDGNGRWAKRKSLPRISGHRAGVKAVQSTVEFSRKIGISALTLYSFSSENWSQPKREIDSLMDILSEFLIKNILVNDVEMMEKLGIYECSPEDFALCSFVCQSKIEVSSIIEKGLKIIEEEA